MLVKSLELGVGKSSGRLMLGREGEKELGLKGEGAEALLGWKWVLS